MILTPYRVTEIPVGGGLKPRFKTRRRVGAESIIHEPTS